MHQKNDFDNPQNPRRLLYQKYVTTFKSEEYSKLDTHWFGLAFENIYLPLLSDVPRNNPVLDLGCGHGLFLELLVKSGFSNAEGIDVSREQVSLAADRGLRVMLTDAIDFLKDKEDAYRVIFAIDFIEHFAVEELFCLIPLIYRSLQEKGILLIRTPNASGLFARRIIYGDLTHRTMFTPASLRQLLKQFNFATIDFFEFPPIPEKMKGKIRLKLWQLIKIVANVCLRVETSDTEAVWTQNMLVRCRKA
jgi:2-polyprenyl-3-methyl-5-hydroxy-6-metoxy-1,4-benzoquinol methylase